VETQKQFAQRNAFRLSDSFKKFGKQKKYECKKEFDGNAECICSFGQNVYCVLQSDEVAVPHEGATNTQTEDLVTFVDGDTPTPETADSWDTVAATGSMMDVGELQKFLSRPVRILNASWAETAPVGQITSMYPWYEYLNTPFIKKKLDNYAWFRAKLHLKVVVNASPFYYGLAMLNYQPLPNNNGAFAGAAADSDYSAGYVQRSQRPHVMILPQDSMGGELEVPFIWPKQYVDLQSATEVQNLGYIELEILKVLQSANGVTGQAVTIQVFAWLSDVQLSGPSLGTALQSKDEYEESTGPVSKVATSVASFANNFAGIPVLGKFAKATSIGASAVGGIARLFGFTNPNVIECAAPRRLVNMPTFASAQVGFPNDKLTFDPKAELTIDGAAVGLDVPDELSISHLAQRQSLMTNLTWYTTDTVDTQLFTYGVNPYVPKIDGGTNQSKARHPPLSFLSAFFGAWRGDIILRFDVIASQYHRGRLLIVYDPSGTAANNVCTVTQPLGTITSHVLDIGVSRSVEIRIPYTQPWPWLKTTPDWVNSSWVNRGSDDASNFFSNKDFYNGNLTVRVLNVLTAPVSSSNVEIFISIKGAENLEFANPREPFKRISAFTVQSKEESFSKYDVWRTPCERTTMGTPSNPDEHRFDMNYGEPVRSLRTLLQRYTLNEAWMPAADTSTALRLDRHVMTRFPLGWGYDPKGAGACLDAATGLIPKNFNLTRSHAFNYIAPAFAAVRGGFNWNIVYVNDSASSQGDHTLSLQRVPYELTAARYGSTGCSVTPLSAATGSFGSQTTYWFAPCRGYETFSRAGTTTGPQNDWCSWVNRTHTLSGAAESVLKQTGSIAATLPHYNDALFQFTKPNYITDPISADRGAESLFHVDLWSWPSQGQTTRCVRMEKWCGAASDLSLLYFINTPLWYMYYSDPSTTNTAV